MSWNSQGGGGGPWGGGGGNSGGPWGGGPRGGGSGGGSGPQPPDIEELLRRGQQNFKRWLPSGGGGGRTIAVILIAVVGIWLSSGFYRVQPSEQGLELLFGEFINRTSPGLNYWLPAPIGETRKINVTQTNSIPIGYRGPGDAGSRNVGTRDVPQESLMLTGDQNIIDIDFVVQWRIKDAADFLFNLANPEGTIKIAAESAMREVIGKTPLEEALTTRRQQVEQDTKALLQQILDNYGVGVFISEVKQDKVDPPQAVIDAFNDVQRAKQDQERSINEAIAYRNDIIPRAKGESERIIQAARAFKEQEVNAAEGEAQKFLDILKAYEGNKKITKRRLYLERMREILSKVDKTIIDEKGGSDVVPYLPLRELKRRGETGGANQ